MHCGQHMLTRRWASQWVTNAALAFLGLWLLALCRQGVSEIHHFVIGFGLVAMYQALGYLVAVWVVLNRPANRWTLAIIVVCAVGCRLVCLFSPPFLSSDIYRYVWDGKVQASGSIRSATSRRMLIWPSCAIRISTPTSIAAPTSHRFPREPRCFSY